MMSAKLSAMCSAAGTVRSVNVELRTICRLSPPMLLLHRPRVVLGRDMAPAGASGIVIVRRSLEIIWGTSFSECVRSRAADVLAQIVILKQIYVRLWSACGSVDTVVASVSVFETAEVGSSEGDAVVDDDTECSSTRKRGEGKPVVWL
jgi:hypothetical protein